MKNVRNYLLLLLAVSSMSATAGQSTLCTYSKNVFKIEDGKVSFGYSLSEADARYEAKRRSGVKQMATRGGQDRRTGKYFNEITLKLFKGKRYTLQVGSRYFQPGAFVVNSRKKRINGRFLGKNARGVWVSQVVYDTDRAYPDEMIRLYVTNRDNRDPRAARGAEVFIRVNLQNEECKTVRSGNITPPKPGGYKPAPGVDLNNPCPPGQRYMLGTCY